MRRGFEIYSSCQHWFVYTGRHSVRPHCSPPRDRPPKPYRWCSSAPSSFDLVIRAKSLKIRAKSLNIQADPLKPGQKWGPTWLDFWKNGAQRCWQNHMKTWLEVIQTEGLLEKMFAHKSGPNIFRAKIFPTPKNLPAPTPTAVPTTVWQNDIKQPFPLAFYH